jgi:uncharacterized protein RhaS with RHS repeats
MWLSDLGLYHYKARAYSPTLGRFLQTDPTGYDDGPNWYAYVDDDPIGGSDPSGMNGIDGGLFYATAASMAATMQIADPREAGKELNKPKGSIALQPQDSAGGAPARITPTMEERLLYLSEQEKKAVNVHSGIRTPEENARVKHPEKNSQHLPKNGGNAADITIDGYTGPQTANAAIQSEQFNRVNIYSDGDDVHVDLKANGNQGLFIDWCHQPDPGKC